MEFYCSPCSKSLTQSAYMSTWACSQSPWPASPCCRARYLAIAYDWANNFPSTSRTGTCPNGMSWSIGINWNAIKCLFRYCLKATSYSFLVEAIRSARNEYLRKALRNSVESDGPARPIRGNWSSVTCTEAWLKIGGIQLLDNEIWSIYLSDCLFLLVDRHPQAQPSNQTSLKKTNIGNGWINKRLVADQSSAVGLIFYIFQIAESLSIDWTVASV